MSARTGSFHLAAVMQLPLAKAPCLDEPIPCIAEVRSWNGSFRPRPLRYQAVGIEAYIHGAVRIGLLEHYYESCKLRGHHENCCQLWINSAPRPDEHHCAWCLQAFSRTQTQSCLHLRPLKRPDEQMSPVWFSESSRSRCPARLHIAI